MTRSNAVVAGVLACALCAGAPAWASTDVDAGDLIENALAVGGGVSAIQGWISSEDGGEPFVDIDVYRLDLPAGEFSAAVTVSTDTLDTALVLFDGTGTGLRADDDSGADACVYCARVTETLSSPGTYYLAVFDVVDVDGPGSDDGLIWADDVFERINATPDGPGKELAWTGWQIFEEPGYAMGYYTIDLSPATIPLPGALPLLAGALAGLALLAPRKRRRGVIGA